eukprot:GFUD01002333.1.p1 GENE.GFUD01002333.1~~GFUD01002333.1.p1  ORF type:complete len:1322 (-),score=442.13 GFUD01002333.1:282-4247(-)
MSDGGGGPLKPKRLSCSLGTEFTLEAGTTDVVCVDLEGEWREDSRVGRHPDYDNKSLEFIKGEVGEGGDHLNVTFKNVGKETVTIGPEEVVIVVTEENGEKITEPGEDNTEKSEDNSKDEEVSNQKSEDDSKVEEASTEASDISNKPSAGQTEAIEPMETESPPESVTSNESSKIPETDKEAESEEKDEATEKDALENEDEAATNSSTAAINPPFRDETQSTSLEETDNDAGEAAGSVSTKTNDASSPKMRFVNESEDEKVDTENVEASDDVNEATKNGEGEEAMETEEQEDKSTDEPNANNQSESKDTNCEEKDALQEINGDDKVDSSENSDKTTERCDEKPDSAGDKTEASGDKTEVSGDKTEVAGDKTDTSVDKKDDKPTLKLASFSSMGQPSQQSQNGTMSPVKGETKGAQGTEGAKQDACSHCARGLNNIHQSIVWETMQFCDENCLGQYQSGMSNCSSCKKDVQTTSLGKYCVRFGSDIKQFCSNVCLEDYKKGLKVCSYCQKDISGGEGFLAPIGDKGQFKDFCEQSCLQKYEHMHLGKKPEVENLPCSVCKETKVVVQEILREKEVVKLCSDPCFSAFKFVNSVETHQCDLCTKHFDVLIPNIHIYYDGLSKIFCSKPCQNVFVMQQRKIVPCAYCKVKKYNFDMIEKFPPGQTTNSHLYCSLNCLNLHNMQMVKLGSIQTGTPTTLQAMQYPGYSPRPAAPLPVISAVSSLAVGGQQQLQQQIQVQTQTVREVVKETHVLPCEVPVFKNKGMQTKPFMMTKGVSCRPHPCHKETQTEGLTQPVPIPIPIPIHIPTPCKMYNAPFPCPVPIPLPFPVPIFIPTTRHSMKGIEKIIKKILNKIPADPFEAELLALAGDIAGGGGDSSDSESDPGDYAKDREYSTPLPNAPTPQQDLENELSGEKIIPKPLPVSTPDPMDRQRMLHNQGYSMGMNKRRQSGRDSDSDPDDPDGTWRPKSQWEQQNPGQAMRGRKPNRGRGGRGGSPQVKRFRADQTGTGGQGAVQAVQQQPKERPDANHHLKFTYGVNAWKHWVVGKNAELEKQRAQGKYQKTFETDILKLRADELNFTLCMFVKEVKKPNGDCYAADSIFYLVLGIQEYLFENTRIDNIFTDVYYDPFTSALHEVVKDFKLPVNELGYFVTRIEEEHLWESKQLGAHSPHVLLNTLVYFNTKYFQLKTVDQHLKLSFSHIMKHWKKTPLANKPGQQQRTVLLRYYPPPAKGQKAEERKMYEQHENHDNPLRCPVKLYEFYLSKCPESTKNRNDMFYLQPERSCVPDSPVWYSAQLLNRFSMEKMLARLLMVREVQEHMLADQTG